MSYGIMLRRLKQEEEREGRRAEGSRAATGLGVPQAPRPGQTPTDIVLAALYERPRRPVRRAA